VKSGRTSRDREASVDLAALGCACATTRRAARAVTQMYDAWLRPNGIESPQFSMLAMLSGLGECSQADLVERFGSDKTTISRNVTLLARHKWVRCSTGRDARERRVRLTSEGRKRLAAAVPAWRAAQEQLRASMSPREWQRVLESLRILTRSALGSRAAGRRP
jgi:DNA-binding MarR family transcriptional regulator